ncbi:hypothetical protein HDE_04872 [Halotydeus destructor]|nr:hypothetical protein HDE_04872 [Halotydeus destructor]
MASRHFILFDILLALALVGVRNANGDPLGAITGSLSCLIKIAGDCEYKRSTDLDGNYERSQCCTFLEYEQCVQNAAKKYCPDSPASYLMDGRASADSGACVNYTLKSPECFDPVYYTGLQYAIVATAIVFLVFLVCYICVSKLREHFDCISN